VAAAAVAQGLRLDGVLIHHLEPETARNDSLLRFANRLPSTLISAETPRRRFSGCPPDGCIASYRVHWPGLVLEPALALVDCAFQADASTDGSADGCLHRRECLPGAERTSQACRWAADQLPLMLEQQRRTAAAKGGNGWVLSHEVVVFIIRSTILHLAGTMYTHMNVIQSTHTMHYNIGGT